MRCLIAVLLLCASTFATEDQRWATKDLTYAFDGVPDEMKPHVQAAMSEWGFYGGFTFKEVAADAGPSVTYHWKARDPQVTAIAITYLRVKDGTILKADVNFSTDTGRWDFYVGSGTTWGLFYWDLGGIISVDIQGIAMHEVGHSLGLVEHDQDPNSVMYYLPTDTSHLLHPIDVARIQKLYAYTVATALDLQLAWMNAIKAPIKVEKLVKRIPRQLNPIEAILAQEVKLAGDRYFYDPNGKFLGSIRAGKWQK